MKRRTILTSITVALLIAATVFGESANSIEGTIADNYKIYYNDGIPFSHDYPIILFDNHTYVAVRDVAKNFHRDVEWVNYDDVLPYVYLKQLPEEEWVIKSKDMALALGKTIICENYPSQINENSYFYAFEVRTQTYGADIMYDIVADFEISEEQKADSVYVLNHANVIVKMNPQDGSFKITKTPEGWVK